MSVTVSESIQVSAFQGMPPESGLPSGIWFAMATVIGDATGASANLFFNFNPQITPLSGVVYNLEQLTWRANGVTPLAVRLQALGFSFRPGTPLDVIAELSFVATAVEGTSSILGRDLAPIKGTFLGQQRVVGTGPILHLDAANVDTRIYQGSVAGYYWDPRATRAPGGPIRPVGGLF